MLVSRPTKAYFIINFNHLQDMVEDGPHAHAVKSLTVVINRTEYKKDTPTFQIKIITATSVVEGYVSYTMWSM